MKVFNIIKIGLLLSLSWLTISNAHAQISACENNTVSVSANNANVTAPYVLEYMLACGGSVISVNNTGMFDLDALGISPGASCVIYAINYDPNETNDLTVAPPTGDCLEFIEQTLTVLNAPDLSVMNITNTCPATTADLTTAVTDADGGTLTYFESDGMTPVADETAVGAGTYVITSTISTGGTDCTDSEVVTVTIVNCDCLDACANGSVTATVTGANTTAPYVLEYVLVCGGTVTSSNSTGTFDLDALGVNPGDNCSIYAANYDSNDGTVDLTSFPFAGDCLETIEQPLCVQGFNDITATTDCGPDDPDQTGVVTITVDAVIQDPNSVFCVYRGSDLLLSTTFGAAATANPNEYQVMITAMGLNGSILTFGVTFAEPGATCAPNPASSECTSDEMVSPDCPLPVEVVDFYGKAEEEVNILNWQTASEINSAWHIIERSPNGKSDWEEVGRVEGAGNSLMVKTYQLVDEKPLQLSYYRLKIVDIDGTESYPSEVVVLKKISKAAGLVKVFPNPTDGHLSIVYESEVSKDLNIYLTDIFGKVLLTQKHIASVGTDNFGVNINSLPNGVYFIHVNGDTKHQFQRIVKQ